MQQQTSGGRKKIKKYQYQTYLHINNMKISNRNNPILYIAIAVLLLTPFVAACSSWTDAEAEDFFIPQSQAYKQNLKDYFNSPHKVMFGWFGNWAGKGGSSMQYSLCGLPDSVDFVSLWLIWGNLSQAQQEDLKEFQEKGSKALLCWRAGDIGAGLTPGGNSRENTKQFWNIVDSIPQSFVQAAQNYALAIVDTCNKYNIDGFDFDLEDWGTLVDYNRREIVNTFLRTLRQEFDKTGKMLVVDIPGGIGWLRFYDVLDDDVVESLDYIVWQTYELGPAGLDRFFLGSNGVKDRKPHLFESTMRKSIVTATFERATDKHFFTQQQNYRSASGIEHAGMGAYHIEYDYPGNPDYPTVRAAITAQNPPISK